MEPELQLFLDTLQQAFDAEALELVENFYARHGVEALRTIQVPCESPDHASAKDWVVPLLSWAILKNHHNLARRLIEIGMSLEDGVSCDDAYSHNQTPLMLACSQSNADMVTLLLRAGANVLHTNEFGVGMLMVVRTAEVCKLIIQHALENNWFNALVLQKTQDDVTALRYANERGHFDVCTEITIGENQALFRAFELSEEAAIEQLNSVLARIEEPLLLPLSPLSPRFVNVHHGNAVSETLLYYAAKKNYLTLVDQLLDLKLSPINDGVMCEIVASDNHKMSPLGIACHHGHIEVMKRLIARGANLLHMTHNKKSLLMLAGTVDVVNVLVHETTKQWGLNTLFSLKYRPDIDAIAYHCILGNIDIVRALLDVPNLFRAVSASSILRYTRYSSLFFPEKSAGFDEICQTLRPHKCDYPQLSMRNVSATSRVTNSSYGYYSLFGRRGAPVTPSLESQKTEAVKSAIVQFYELLIKPEACVPYLAFLNDELCRYYTEKHGKPFPELDNKTYHFVLIEGLPYPVPSAEYQPLEKHKALQELLIAVFRQYGMAGQAYQWIGFIPNDKADIQVKQGDFVFESNYGSGLFHGKLSHMLQRIILIYAIEKGDIKITFEHDQQCHKLLVRDVLEGLVSLNTVDGIHAWGRVKDMRMHHSIGFNDPHRLFSTLMCEGESLGCAALADSLIDGFCKGLQRYYQAWIRHTPFTGIDFAAFIAQQGDFELARFFMSPALIRAEMEEAAQKRQLQPDTIEHSDEYALVSKQYQPNAHFVPKPFSDSSLSHGARASA